jgi:hypothetical protein
MEKVAAGSKIGKGGGAMDALSCGYGYCFLPRSMKNLYGSIGVCVVLGGTKTPVCKRL